MPSQSKKQHNLMAAVAHNPKFAKKVGISQKVGKEFVAADKGKHFKEDEENLVQLDQGLELTKKLKEIIDNNGENNFWSYPGIQKSLQDAYNAGKEDQKAGKIYPQSSAEMNEPEQEVEESELDSHSRWLLDGGMNTVQENEGNFGPVSLNQTVWGKKSRDLIDGALRLTANAKTSDERRNILKKYADEHSVSESDLLNAIQSDTGNTYFDQDDYTKGVTFDESQKILIKSITESFKKIR